MPHTTAGAYAPLYRSLHGSIQFASGGAELLAGGVKRHALSLPALPDGGVWTMGRLLRHVADNVLQERQELFLQGDTVCVW